jgi:antibiotic biosynthesis monooxygenase (ABM) superfamily enzyme
MLKNKAIVVISQECNPEKEAEFNNWYFNVHIPMAMKYPGLRKATRCRVQTSTNGQKGYLTIFEFKDQTAMAGFVKSPEVADALAEMNEKWQGKLPFEIKWRNEYELMQTWEK